MSFSKICIWGICSHCLSEVHLQCRTEEYPPQFIKEALKAWGIKRTKLDATDEMQVGTNPPPVDYFGEQNSPFSVWWVCLQSKLQVTVWDMCIHSAGNKQDIR